MGFRTSSSTSLSTGTPEQHNNSFKATPLRGAAYSGVRPMKAILRTLTISTLLCGVSEASQPPAKAAPSVVMDSISVTFDVGGGFKNSIWLRDDADGSMTIALDVIEPRPTDKWAASFYIGTYAVGRDERYLFNITVDQTGRKARATFRLADKEKAIFDRTADIVLDVRKKVHVTIDSTKSTFSVSINGKLLDTAELPYDPDFIQIGATSGKFRATF